MSETLGSEIVTEWYDGPLRSVRVVEFADRDRLVQVETVLATVGEPMTIGHDTNAREVVVRFTRDELVNMIAVIDGKPIADWRDDARISIVDNAPHSAAEGATTP